MERRPLRRATFGAVLCVAGLVSLGFALSRCTPTVPDAEVHGSLYLGGRDITGAPKGGGQIFIPDLLVALKNTDSATTVSTTRTDLSGHYYFKKQPAGNYQVCWAGSGFVAGCSATFVLAGETAYPGMLPVAASNNTVVGRATLADGRPCYVNDAFFGVSLNATATLSDGASGVGIAPPVRANTNGYYVLAGFKQDPAIGLKVHVVCEKAIADAVITAQNVQGVQLDVTLPNTSPKIQTVVARLGGRGVRFATLNTLLSAQVQAADLDGHVIHYKWRTIGGGSLTDLDATSAPWTLPGGPGKTFAYVLAYDGYGGYSQDRIPISVRNKAEAQFEGRVIDYDTRAPIKDADVSVHGATTKTDALGYFALNTPEDTSDRYVLNVKKVGYALVSQIYTGDSLGGIYELQQASSSVVDPHLGIDVTDVANDTRQKRLSGARIVIAPDSMTISGPLTVHRLTLDPSRKPIPGDYRAVDKSGSEVNLASYGTVFAEFRDASGNLANLLPGKTATVFFPIPPTHVASAPPTIPVWTYDETAGVWREESKAVLVSTSSGPMYQGTTTHFSTLNTDIDKGPNAKCLRVRVDPTQIPAGIKMRVTVPTAPTAQQVQEFTLDSDEYQAIYRLPDTGNVQLDVIDSNNNVIPGASQTINMAAHPAMTGPTLWPPYPYTDCGDSIPVGITMPPYGEQSQGKPYFLTGPFGQFNAPDPSIIDAAAMSNAYYDAIDPDHTRTTLGAWWSVNGFDPTTGAGGTRASYMNFNDLGLGRDMHCAQNTGAGTVACYVANYGLPDQNPANATLANIANTAQAVATVAMEYSIIDHTSTKVVKFYVYQGGQATGARLTAAVLDAFGPRPVPQVCTVCHGGTYNPIDYAHPTAAEANLGSSFREFDLATFKYPPGGHDYPPTVATGQGSLDDFKALNQMVVASNPAPSITQVINTWYPGSSSTPVLTTPVSGWSGSPENSLYLDVVAPSCRTCHVARDGVLRFDTYDKFATQSPTINYLVCQDTPPNRDNKRMPNAVVTYKNFWQSVPSRPAELAAFSHAATSGAPAWVAFGSCQ